MVQLEESTLVSATDSKAAESTNAAPTKRRVPHRMRADTEREELFMARMQSKQDFSTNPRYTKQVQQAAVREGHACAKGVQSENGSLPFGVSPAVVSFQDYTVGGVYFADVVITSSATISCRLRSLPPSRSEFSVTPLQFPMNENGQLAPGMSCHCKVIFAPVHLAQVQDSFSVATQLGVIHIKLAGERPKPQLALPKVLELGPCLVGSKVTRTLSVQNQGGTGRFLTMCTKDCLPIGELPERVVSQHRWVESPEDEWPHRAEDLVTSSFHLGGTGFRLAQNEASQIRVTFAPESLGPVQDECYIVCDDCSYTPIRFSGTGSAPQVVVTQIDELSFEDGTELPSELEFGELCVSCSRERVITFSNSCEMELQFSWMLFEAQDHAPDCSSLPGISAVPVANGLVPSTGAFSVWPSQGSIGPNQSLQVTVRFGPESQGMEAALARLLIKEPLSAMEQTMAEFRLAGSARLCELEISPPVVFFSGTLLMGKSYSRQFSVTNHGDAPTSFNWGSDQHNTQETSLQISPASGTLGAHQTLQFSMTLCSAVPQPNLQLSTECSFGLGKPVVLFAEAQVKGPEIRLQEPSIDYGLVALQHRVSYNVTLTNDSESPAQWLLCEPGGLEGQEEAPREFFFVPPHGCIAPQSSDVVTVCFKPHTCGKAERFLELHTEDEHTQYLRCNAMVQAPKVCLSSSTVQLGTTYLGVRAPQAITVRNLSMLPTHVCWEAVQVEGMTVEFQPASATLKPAEELQVTIVFEPSCSGPLSCLLMCVVEGLQAPLGLQVHTTVATLQVEYKLLEAPEQQPVQIHFGEQVPIFSAPTRTLQIINNSAIPADYQLHVHKFVSVGAPTATAPSLPSGVRFGEAFSAALGSTMKDSTMPPTARTSKSQRSVESSSAPASSHETARFRSEHGRSLVAARIRHAQEQSALSKDCGLAVGLSCESGVVGAWQTVDILLTCFSNMPGHYTDTLECQVADLPPAKFPLSVTVCGSPLQFDPTAVGLRLPPDQAWGQYKFEPNLVCGPRVSKTLTLLNSGPLELLASFKVLSEPKPFQAADVCFQFGDTARAEVIPHVLEQAEAPFSVSPAVLSVPAKGKANFTVSMAVGADPALVQQCLIVDSSPKGGHPHAELPRALLPANYLNLEALVLLPELSTSPQNKLLFQCLSSQSLSHSSRTRTVHLSNNTKSIFSFGLDTSGPFSLVSVQCEDPESFDDPAPRPKGTKRATNPGHQQCTLKPLESLSVCVHFCEEPLELAPESHQSLATGQLLISFENGTLQSLELAASTTYPAACLSEVELDFGVVRVGSHAAQSLTVTALTPACSQWRLTEQGSSAAPPPRRGSVSIARRNSLTGTVPVEAPTLEGGPGSSCFGFEVSRGFLGVETELRLWSQGGEQVARRQRLDVGGWLASLSTEECFEFYSAAAAKSLVAPNPWGRKLVDWISYHRDCSPEAKQRVLQAMKGADTFGFVFPGEDLAQWYALRKSAIRAGFLEGRPVHLREDPSEAGLAVNFSPTGDQCYTSRFEVTLEHGRKYSLVLRGQGTSDEELCL